MKWILLVLIILFILFMLFYGGYYLIKPDVRGEDILDGLNIPHPAVIAHRGASVIAPESTRPAYEKARDTGADYFEADLQRTADGEIVLFHDPTLPKKSNIAEVFPDRIRDEVGDFTLAELRQLDFGSWFNREHPRYAQEEYRNLKILTLQELVEIAQTGEHTPGLILETKYPEKYPGIEDDIIEILAEAGWLQDDEDNFTKTIFFSFSIASLRRFQELVPDKPRLLLVTDSMISHRSWSNWLDRAEDVAHGLGPKGFMAWPWHIASAHDRKIFVFPYTINSLWQIRVIAHFQASGFITDRPEVVLNFLDRLPELPSIEELVEQEEDDKE